MQQAGSGGQQDRGPPPSDSSLVGVNHDVGANRSCTYLSQERYDDLNNAPPGTRAWEPTFDDPDKVPRWVEPLAWDADGVLYHPVERGARSLAGALCRPRQD